MTLCRFMTHWDGLASTNAAGTPQRICILGATNRIQDIDEAILRRMPKKFPVSLPNTSQRRRIFKLILRGTKVDRAHFDLDYLVRVSAGMSGSDIKEACRDAAMFPVREYIKNRQARGATLRGVDPKQVRGIRSADFFRKPGTQKELDVDDDDDASDTDVNSVGRVATESDESSESEEDDYKEPATEGPR